MYASESIQKSGEECKHSRRTFVCFLPASLRETGARRKRRCVHRREENCLRCLNTQNPKVSPLLISNRFTYFGDDTENCSMYRIVGKNCQRNRIPGRYRVRQRRLRRVPDFRRKAG